ncbi:glycosyltransferase [Thermococcus sibiricus]|uniref:Glycosyltransferase n=1 Tax=Thermococcus sibiricus (strain DSM 12597 / MM 739) TaxID=604354 RepID=C6A091_THESM|nr:glycosyltransferase [Thermococcus sibiricus]ACS91072.1 glycosyltransferase [Thermococcus sibiricus MM 739]
MRIVMTVTNPFKPDPRVYKEAKSLAKHGHEVYIIAWDREGKYPKEEVIEGFRVIRVGPKAGYGPLMALKLPLFYLNAFRVILKLKPDAIHTHDFDTAVLGFFFKKLKKKVMWVYDVHDLYESFVRNNRVSSLIKRLDSIIMGKADIVITVNQEMMKILLERARPNMTVIIMNTINPFGVSQKKAKIFTIFYGGVLSEGRFVKEIVDISSTLDVSIRIAGSGTLKDEIKSSSAVYLGHVPHERALEELSRAHVTFILYDPSVLNNKIASPNKLFEAMWTGTPVLVVKGTLPEKLAEKFVIPVDYSKSAVKKALKEIIETPKVIKKKAHFGRKIFLKKYTWDIMEKRLIKLYSEVLK